RALLESTARKIAKVDPAKAGDVLTEAATALTTAFANESSHLGLLEELAWVYDRLGEHVATTSAESEYRRLELVAARRLLNAAPELPAAHRTWALACFRVGANPLAA